MKTPVAKAPNGSPPARAGQEDDHRGTEAQRVKKKKRKKTKRDGDYTD